MREVQFRWAQGRRQIVMGALVTAGLIVAPHVALAQAPAPAPPAQTPQQPAPQPPAGQQQQQQPGLTFDGDAGLILMQIKPDKTADFEAVMVRLHEALTKTDKPERKQQAQGWKIYKSTDPGPNGNVLYVAVIDPALKGADYTVAKILYEVFPTEVQQIFPQYRDAFAAGLNKVNLNLVQNLGGPASAASAPAPSTPTPGSAGTGTTGTGSTPPPAGTNPPRQ
jgi:hypothetical protein